MFIRCTFVYVYMYMYVLQKKCIYAHIPMNTPGMSNAWVHRWQPEQGALMACARSGTGNYETR